MKKTLLIILMGIAFSFVCETLRADDKAESNEYYTSHELFQVYWGAGPGQIGHIVSEGSLKSPSYFTVDGEENIYIEDIVNKRIIKLNKQGQSLENIDFPNLPARGHIKMVSDKKNNLWVFYRSNDGQFLFNVYTKSGKIIKESTPIGQMNNIQIIPDQMNTPRLYFEPKEINTNKQKQKPLITHQFQIDEDNFKIKKMSIDALPEIIIGKETIGLERTPENNNTGWYITVKNKKSEIVENLRGYFLRIDSEGTIYNQSPARTISFFNPYTMKKGSLDLIGNIIAAASPYVDLYGNIYQIDLIPDTTDEELNSIYPPLREEEKKWHHSSLDTPGIRIIRWEKNK